MNIKVKPNRSIKDATANLVLMLVFLFAGNFLNAQVPVITSFSPALGPVGTLVTITGTGFSTTAANNLVYFGGVKAIVSSATNSSVIVDVPAGASYSPITVTNNSLTAYSKKPFLVTFPGGNAGFKPGSFALKMDVVASLDPARVTAGDIDGDGKNDLIVASSGSTTISILRNQSKIGSLDFAPHVDILTPSSLNYGVCTGDIDGDGKLDMVSVGTLGNTLSLFKNTSIPGVISFATRIDIATGASPFDVAIRDIDKDGRPDIIVANNGANSISVFRNTGNAGNFSFANRVDFASGAEPISIAFGDIDSDGSEDIAVANPRSRTISLFRNTSTPGMIALASKVDFTPGRNPFMVVVGDLDMDGKPDMASVNYFDYTVSVFLNTSIGNNFSFSGKADFSAPSSPQSIAIGDMDGDGKPDIAVAKYSGNNSILRNKSAVGVIAFDAQVEYGSPAYTDGIVLADFDGDGKADMAVGNDYGTNLVAVLRNKINEPDILAISPASGGAGTIITIKGTNFSGTTSVNIGGIPAASFTVVDSATITAVVANGAFTNEVSVTGTYGTGKFLGFIYKGPHILNFTPHHSGSGKIITITGHNFIWTSGIKFGATDALSFTIVDSTTINAVVGNGSSGKVTVTTPNGFDAIDSFVYYFQPTILSFTPVAAFNGNSVTISGTHFTSTSEVNFGGIPATSFSVTNDSTITAILGIGASGDITVTTIGGIATKSGFSFTGPAIQSFTPQSAHSGDTIYISGSNFNGTSNISFAGTAAVSFILLNDSTVKAVIGNGATGNVSITTINGTAIKNGFVYTGPVITSITPGFTGKGRTVVIRGTNFASASSVSFGGSNAAYFSVDSVTKITAVVDTGSSGDVIVVTSIGVASKPGFIFAQPPEIISFTPAAAGYGTGITIKGKHFSGTESINIGPVAAYSFTVVSDTVITAYVGQTSSGTIMLSTPGGSAIIPGFTFVLPPVINSFTPVNAVPGTTVTLTGINFTNVYYVRFGFTSAKSFTVVSDSVITAVVGNGNTGSVYVFGSGGGASKTGFTYIPPPTNILLCPPVASTSFTSNITGNSYRWQLNSGNGFINLIDNVNYMGSTNQTLQVTSALSSWNGNIYRCLVGGGTVYSNSFKLAFNNSWTGTGGTAWENPANWSCGTLPDMNTDVTIASGTILVNSSTVIRSLALKPGVIFTVNPNVTLTILQ